MLLLLIITAGLLCVGVLVLIHAWTLRAVRTRSMSAWWIRSYVAAVVMGVIGGLVSSGVRWFDADNAQYVGLPLPGVIVLREDGKWIDYAGPPTIICPLLNMLLVATVCVLPISLAVLLRRQRVHSGRGRSPLDRSNPREMTE